MLYSWVGALAILATEFILVSKWITPSHYDAAANEFGTPESMASISELYALIEKSSHDPKLLQQGNRVSEELQRSLDSKGFEGGDWVNWRAKTIPFSIWLLSK